MADVIVGTDSDTYTPVTADVGADLYCRVTATNAAGSASANSNTVGPVTAAAAGWTPADLPGLLAWYKADTGVTIVPVVITALPAKAEVTPRTVTGTVSQWADQSGNGYHLLQATGANQPDFDPVGFNGHPGLFTQPGFGQFLQTAEGVARGTGGVFSCFIAVTGKTGVPDNSRLVVYLAPGATTDFSDLGSGCMLMNATGASVRAFKDSVLGALKAYTAEAPSRYGSIFDGANNEIYVNNVASGAPAAITGTFTTGGSIRYSSISDPWYGFVAEIVVTTTALDSTQRLALDDYFKAKWGLT